VGDDAGVTKNGDEFGDADQEPSADSLVPRHDVRFTRQPDDVRIDSGNLWVYEHLGHSFIWKYRSIKEELNLNLAADLPRRNVRSIRRKLSPFCTPDLN
jgi:hypothetical protein